MGYHDITVSQLNERIALDSSLKCILANEPRISTSNE